MPVGSAAASSTTSSRASPTPWARVAASHADGWGTARLRKVEPPGQRALRREGSGDELVRRKVLYGGITQPCRRLCLRSHLLGRGWPPHEGEPHMNKTLGIAAAAALIALGTGAGLKAQQAGMTFFLTSAGPGKGGDLGGLAGADRHCQTLAQAAGAGAKTWHAYLSTQG